MTTATRPNRGLAVPTFDAEPVHIMAETTPEPTDAPNCPVHMADRAAKRAELARLNARSSENDRAAIGSIESNLQRTCRNAALHSEMAALQAKARPHIVKLNEATERLSDANSVWMAKAFESARLAHSKETTPAAANKAGPDADTLRAKRVTAQSAVDAIQSVIEGIQRQMDAISVRMRESAT